VARNCNNTLQARALAAERQLEIAKLARIEFERSRKSDQIKQINEETKAGNEDGKIKNRVRLILTISRA
jgi:uncharacterized protein (UPF0335 family)